jgi:hypothetical protein
MYRYVSRIASIRLDLAVFDRRRQFDNSCSIWTTRTNWFRELSYDLIVWYALQLIPWLHCRCYSCGGIPRYCVHLSSCKPAHFYWWLFVTYSYRSIWLFSSYDYCFITGQTVFFPKYNLLYFPVQGRQQNISYVNIYFGSLSIFCLTHLL